MGLGSTDEFVDSTATEGLGATAADSGLTSPGTWFWSSADCFSWIGLCSASGLPSPD